MQIRIDCKNEEEWLAERCNHIGGSDCAALLGVSKWKSNVDLYREKVGAVQRFVTNEAIELGKRAEPALRELYSAYNPEMAIDYHQYTIIFQEEYPFIASTLDGELTDAFDRKGILEIKTATPNGKAGWAKWDNQIPQQYFVQIVHQLLATKYDYAILYAALFNQEGNIFIREYSLEAEDAEMDMEWLLGRETEFWQSVESKSVPAMSIAF